MAYKSTALALTLEVSLRCLIDAVGAGDCLQHDGGNGAGTLLLYLLSQCKQTALGDLRNIRRIR